MLCNHARVCVCNEYVPKFSTREDDAAYVLIVLTLSVVHTRTTETQRKTLYGNFLLTLSFGLCFVLYCDANGHGQAAPKPQHMYSTYAHVCIRNCVVALLRSCVVLHMTLPEHSVRSHISTSPIALDIRANGWYISVPVCTVNVSAGLHRMHLRIVTHSRSTFNDFGT